ncbi:MAG: LysR family transcriptional regulator [Treponema sp.]|nr:LysR family transcriptional regulator [Treponema sp.]
MDTELLRERARIFRNIRRFFDERNYLEVDTPLLSPFLIPETCLEVFETRRIMPPGSRQKEKAYWLLPSPELWMKKLLAKNRQSLYQICHCFRNGESSGRLHSPEFAMLEYYTVGADYMDSLRLTEELLSSLGFPHPAFRRLSMAEAFAEYAGFDLYGSAAEGSMEEEGRRLGLEIPPGLGTHEIYDLIFIHAVEPRLRGEQPVALLDYPAFVPCLAKKSSAGNTVERWELYINGVELANCYTEETDPDEVRRYFAAEGEAKRKTALVPHAVDPAYWQIFKNTQAEQSEGLSKRQSGGLPKRESGGLSKRKSFGFPQCSGVAMGLDRLVMALTGRSSIDGVLPFPME